MLDPKLIRGDLSMLADQLARRQFVLEVETLSELEAKRKSAQTAMETLQAERNRVSKAIGQAKAKWRRHSTDYGDGLGLRHAAGSSEGGLR